MFDSWSAFFGEVLWFGDGSTGTTSANTQIDDQLAGKYNKNLKSDKITLKAINDTYIQGFSLITDLVQKIMKVSTKELKKELKVNARALDNGYDSFLYGTFIQEVATTAENKTEDEFSDDDTTIRDTQTKEKNIYVRWDLLCQMINHLCTPGYKTKHEPLVELTYLNPFQRAYNSKTQSSEGKIISPSDEGNPAGYFDPSSQPKEYMDYSLPAENKIHPTVNDKKLKALLGQSFDYNVCIMPHQLDDSLILEKYQPKEKPLPVVEEWVEADNTAEEEAEVGLLEQSLFDIYDSDGCEKGKAAWDVDLEMCVALPTIFDDLLVQRSDYTGNDGLVMQKFRADALVEVTATYDPTDEPEFIQDEHNSEENYQPLTSFTDVKFTNQSIGLVYFNLDHLISEYENQRLETTTVDEKQVSRLKEKFSFFEFIDKIWGNVNRACAGYYDFSLQTEHERPHVARIIDKTISGDPPPNIFTFNPQGKNSITRDFEFTSKISSDMASVVSIAAQAPNNAQSLDAMSFKSFHKNIRNRFTDNELDEKSKIYGELVVKKPVSTVATEEEAAEIAEIAAEALVAKTELEKDMKKYGVMFEDLANYQSRSNNQYRAAYGSDSEELFGTYASNLSAASAIQIAKDIEELLIQINARYPLKDKDGNPHKKAGRYNPLATNDRSAIIPLEFNLKMDGIAGISPLNLFKIHPEKLPHGYQREDIAFIVKGESQKISAGQDWTTTLNGQLTLLNTNTSDEGKNEVVDFVVPAPEKDDADNIDKIKHGEKTPAGPKDGLINPVAHSIYITSPWGKERKKTGGGWIRHYGVDIRASTRGVSGDDILAPADGVVKKANFSSGACGGTIEIKHTTTGDLSMTRYCHIKEMKVTSGSAVSQGDVIGIMGGNINDKGRGSSTATHLHYEVYDGDTNPEWWKTISNGEKNTKSSTGTSDPAKYLA